MFESIQNFIKSLKINETEETAAYKRIAAAEAATIGRTDYIRRL